MTDTPSVRARRPRRDSLHNRAAILDAARAALARDPRASIDSIAQDAGLSRRALYGHFGDRDALIAALNESGAERFNAIAGGIRHSDARIELALLTAALWREAATVQVAAAMALDDEHATDTGTALAPLRARVADIVERGQADHTLRADVAAPLLARLIEETARTVIIRIDAAQTDAASVAVRAVLSISGMSWRETQQLLDEHPEVLR